ncbi:hypothetical protein R3P38DRAFT_3203745 [Favolaschia claudopus]|uniref:Uncharacterized protein n=1 Tax=Favolaschia claudopus TaxID=2862362 RepID=A0AAW0ASH7_9AGAR
MLSTAFAASAAIVALAPSVPPLRRRFCAHRPPRALSTLDDSVPIFRYASPFMSVASLAHPTLAQFGLPLLIAAVVTLYWEPAFNEPSPCCLVVPTSPSDFPDVISSRSLPFPVRKNLSVAPSPSTIALGHFVLSTALSLAVAACFVGSHLSSATSASAAARALAPTDVFASTTPLLKFSVALNHRLHLVLSSSICAVICSSYPFTAVNVASTAAVVALLADCLHLADCSRISRFIIIVVAYFNPIHRFQFRALFLIPQPIKNRF